MMALGFTNAVVKVWTLNPHKLKGLKSADALEMINRDADDVLHRMLDENSAESMLECLFYDCQNLGNF